MADPIPSEMLPQEVAALRELARGSAQQLSALVRVLIEKGIITREELERAR
jgi:hypothetical protein